MVRGYGVPCERPAFVCRGQVSLLVTQCREAEMLCEIPVVTRECRRNSRKTTWFPPLGKMTPLPATGGLQVRSGVGGLDAPWEGSTGCVKTEVIPGLCSEWGEDELVPTRWVERDLSHQV